MQQSRISKLRQLSQPSRPAIPADGWVLGNGPPAHPRMTSVGMIQQCTTTESVRHTPRPVIPEMPQALSGTFHGRCIVRTHHGAGMIPDICHVFRAPNSGKTGGGFGNGKNPRRILGQGPRVQRSRSPKLRLLSLPTHPTTPADVCVLGSARTGAPEDDTHCGARPPMSRPRVIPPSPAKPARLLVLPNRGIITGQCSLAATRDQYFPVRHSRPDCCPAIVPP
jgi:hypothetical protein